MKKTFVKILCVITVITLACSLSVLAEDYPAIVNLGSTSDVNPGDEAVIIVDTIINPGFNIQGVQIDFKFSENFPELKKAEIIQNTTGWDTTGVSRNNLLAIGDVIENQAQMVAKITFDVPLDAPDGTEYDFAISNAIVADAEQTLPVNLKSDTVKIVVAGVKADEPADETPEPEEKPEIKPDEQDKKPEPEIEDTVQKPEPDLEDEKEPVPEPDNTQDDNAKSETDEDVSKPEVSVSPEKNDKTEEKEDVKEEVKEEPLPWKNPFSDIKENDWFYESVRFVFEKGLMSGVDANAFAPNSTLTRAMLVTILHRFEGSPVASSYGFSDIAPNAWYTNGVDWAASTGIVKGVGDNAFAPDLPVTREQITLIFYNYTKYKKMISGGRKDLSVYADDTEISSWAVTAFEWAVSTGLINGKENNRLDPSGNATRAEISAIIKRYVENITE